MRDDHKTTILPAEPAEDLKPLAELDLNLAERIARVLVFRSESWRRDQKKTHLCVCTDYLGFVLHHDKNPPHPPPFSYHWQTSHRYGCSWPRFDRDAAIAWAKTALEAGYTVFYGIPRSGGGDSPFLDG